MSQNGSLEILADDLARSPELSGYVVRAVPALDLIAVLSPDAGVATLAMSPEPAAASAASARFSVAAKAAGVEIHPTAFGMSSSGAPPSILRETAPALDISRAMQAAARERGGGPGREVVDRIVAALPAISAPKKSAGIPPGILEVAEAAVRKVLDDQPAWLYGIDIRARDIVRPTYFLPALLVVAAIRWAPPVVAAGRKGGFKVTLAQDPNGSVLGFKVSAIEISNPVLFFLPIVDLLRRSFKNGECWVDEIIEDYAVYMRNHGYDSNIQDLEVRVVVGNG